MRSERRRSERFADGDASRARRGRQARACREETAAKARSQDPGEPGAARPNYWSYDPAIRLLVDLGSLEHWPSNTIPAFNDALIDLLPGLHDHGCSLHRPGGFIERLRDGTWMGHVAEHVALELQRETGATTTRGKTRRAGTPGYYHVVYGYNEEQVGLAAGKLAIRLLNHLVQANPTFD